LANGIGEVGELVNFSQINRPGGTGGFQVAPERKVGSCISARNRNINVRAITELSGPGDGAEEVNVSDLGIVGDDLGDRTDRVITGLLSQGFPCSLLCCCPLSKVVSTLLEVDRHRLRVANLS
jgi:hypothetical protein